MLKIGFYVSLLWLSSHILAQEYLPDSTLDEIVVTHSKVPMPSRNTIKPVQIITREQIEKNSWLDLAQVLNSQAGIIVNNAYSNPSSSKSVYTRGATGQYTLILIDGLVANDPSSVVGTDIRFFNLEQIERIEILKGSQSTLYGSDAIAGVINIITKKNKSSEKVCNVFGKLGYGAFNTFDTNIGIKGKINTFDYNASYQYLSTDGISEALDPFGNQNFDNDGYTQNNFQVNLGFLPSQKIKLLPFLRYNQFTGDFDGGSFFDLDSTNYDIRFLNTGLKVEFNFNKLFISANYSYTQTNNLFNFGTSSSQFTSDGYFHNIDIFGNWKFDNKIQILGGLNIQNSDMSATPNTSNANLSGLYLNTLIQDIKGFYFEIGGRFNHHSEYGNNLTYNISAAYYYKSFKILASYTTGFKVPTLFELYGSIGNTQLMPQTSKSFEVGFEYLNNDKFKSRVVYFNRGIDNIITFESNKYVNLFQQRGQGIEFSTDLNLGKLSIQGTYNFVIGKTTDPGGFISNNLLRRPKHNFSLNTTYNFIPDLSIFVQLQYIGKRLDVFFDPNTSISSNINLDSYFLINLRATYQPIKRMSIYLDVKNLTNTSFIEVYGFSHLPISLQGGVRFNF